jgi:hypothetical protein
MIHNYSNVDCLVGANFNSLKDVNSDNVGARLNEEFQGFFSYESEILVLSGFLMKVTLNTPVKSAVGYAEIKPPFTDTEQATRKALAEACRVAFQTEVAASTQTPIEESKPVENVQPSNNQSNEALTTLEDVEKELNIQQSELIPFDPTPAPTKENNFGLRQDQIDFMKMFQQALKIDTTEKFDEYVKAWASTNSAFPLHSKAELIAYGAVALDSFIAWIKEVYKDNIANNTFAFPSDSQLEEACK